MRKNYFRSLLSALFLAAALAPAVLSAQFAGDLKFGVQFSPTFSSMRTDNNLINADGSNLGLKLGVLADYYFAENYSFHTGLGFHFNAGGTLFYEDQFDRVDIWREALDGALTSPPDSIAGGIGFKYNLQFVEIPLGLTLRTREFGYLKYFVRPSLHLGFLTKSRGQVRGPSNNFIDEEEDFDISSAVNSVNLSWSIGGGVEYAVSEATALIAGISYQSGFADLTTDKDTQVIRQGRNPREDDSKGRLGAFVITLGVMF